MQKEINDLLLVGVPKNATRITITNHQDGLIYYVDCKSVQIDFTPKTKYKIVAFVPGITEDQARPLVENVNESQQNWYRNYNKPAICGKDKHWFQTALEAFTSLMQANGAYLENPYGKYKAKELDEYWPSICSGGCGWRGLSRDCAGGEAIADTGDYTDPYCPKCGSAEKDDVEWQAAQESTSAKWAVLQLIK